MTNGDGQWIRRLFIKDVGPFNDIIFQFDRRMNLIIGDNGVGKTLLLKLIASCLSTRDIKQIRPNNSNFEFWFEFQDGDRQFGVGLPEGAFRGLEDYQKTGIQVRVKVPVDYQKNKSDGFFFSFDYQRQDDQRYLGQTNFVPLFIGPLNRQLKQTIISGFQAEEDLAVSRSSYITNSLDDVIKSQIEEVSQWMVNRYNNAKAGYSWARIETENWNYLINNFNLIIPKGDTLEWLEPDKTFKLRCLYNGIETYLEELSSGFQSVLGIIFTIFKWIEAVNSGQNQKVANASGTVIIDEIDLHLHPEWQRRIISNLKNVFPRLQFIITTHSPHVARTTLPHEIFVLRKEILESQSRVIIKSIQSKYQAMIDSINDEKDVSFAGWSTDEILQDIMNVDLHDENHYQLIEQILEEIAQAKFDIAESLLLDLERITHPNNSILKVLKLKMADSKARNTLKEND